MEHVDPGQSLSLKTAEHAKATYDKVAGEYDDLWSKHVAEPNARLTRALKLKKGERLADLACGTAIFTLDMARATAPGETVCVDYSEGMLDAARERAEAAGLSLTFVHAKAEDFIAACAPSDFDAVSFRFALAYVDWRDVLPKMGRMVRPGGRVGILTSLGDSIPQARIIYEQLMQAFGEPQPPTQVPGDADEIARLLGAGGLVPDDVWTWRFRLWFESGTQAAAWLRASGYASHPSLANASPEALQSLEQLFAAGLEGFRESSGVPLDIVTGAAVGRRP
jgi:ubiquinone/menaquinone biosynthesis C-methylase UbiE